MRVVPSAVGCGEDPLSGRSGALRVSPEQLKWYREKVAVKGAELTDQEYPTDPETCSLLSAGSSRRSQGSCSAGGDGPSST